MKTNKQIILFLTFMLLIILSLTVYHTVKANQEESLLFVYLDPGHGGFDGGATSIDKSMCEKDINLKVCFYLKNYLEKTNIVVKMTRNKDVALSKSKKEDIHKRVELINKSNCDIYLTIHANAYPSSSVRGFQTFYSSNKQQNEYLAKTIQTSLQMLDKENKRLSKVITGKYVLDNTTKIGCLVEIGFLTNEIDLQKLTDDTYLEKMAFQIYLGILNYIEESRQI